MSSIEFYNSALDALETGNLPAALTAIENALMEDAADAQSWQLYVMILKALGRFEDAENATSKLKELGLTEFDGLLMQAAEAAAGGDSASAIASYRAAIEIDPGHPEIHAGLALALMESGDPASARTAAEQAVAIAPENSHAHYAYGRILRLSGDKSAALAAFDRAIALDPEFPMALYEQGMLLVENDRLHEALANFEKFLKAHPGDPSALTAVESVKADLARTTTH
jgi:tetratricopeptide (TPR) repeat protein